MIKIIFNVYAREIWVLSLEFVKLSLPSFPIEPSCNIFMCLLIHVYTNISAKSSPRAHELLIWTVLFFSITLLLEQSCSSNKSPNQTTLLSYLLFTLHEELVISSLILLHQSGSNIFSLLLIKL